MRRMQMRIVRAIDEADDLSIMVSLFRGEDELVRAWMIGPVGMRRGCLSIPYLPRSVSALAAVVIYRGIAAAGLDGRDVSIVDPEGLWPQVWDLPEA